MAKHPQRIGTIVAVIMVIIALAVDGLQFLLTLSVFLSPLSWLLTICAATGFFIWFALCGVNYFGKGAALKIVTMIATVVAEFIPIVNAVPAFTLGVSVLIGQTKIEDAGIKINPKSAARIAAGAAKGGVGGAALAAVRERRAVSSPPPRAANDNSPSAANDNEQETARRAA